MLARKMLARAGLVRTKSLKNLGAGSSARELPGRVKPSSNQGNLKHQEKPCRVRRGSPVDIFRGRMARILRLSSDISELFLASPGLRLATSAARSRLGSPRSLSVSLVRGNTAWVSPSAELTFRML